MPRALGIVLFVSNTAHTNQGPKGQKGDPMSLEFNILNADRTMSAIVVEGESIKAIYAKFIAEHDGLNANVRYTRTLEPVMPLVKFG